MTTSNFTGFYQAYLLTQKKLRGVGNKIAVRKVVKANIGEFKEEVREGCSIRMRKELTGVMQIIPDNNRFLMSFQYRCENSLSSNQPTIMILYKTLEEKEPEIFTDPEIPVIENY